MTRNEAKEILQAVKFLLPIEEYSERVEEALDMAIEALEQPTADVREKVRGEWIYNGLSESVDRVYCCSICGVALDDYIFDWINTEDDYCSFAERREDAT